MPTPKLARLLLGILALETGICTIFLADEWPPFRNFEKKIFSAFLRNTRGSEAYVVEDADTGTRERLVRPLNSGTPLRYLRVEVDQDNKSALGDDGIPVDEVFQSYPLAPLDWALITKKSHEANCRTLAIDTPLSWEKKDEIDLKRLNQVISSFDYSILTVDLNLGRQGDAVSQSPPSYITRNAIPLSTIQGKANHVPLVNRVTLPPSALGNDDTRFSFRLLDNTPEAGLQEKPSQTFFTPAFARWGDVLIPSFPLAVAMARYEAEPEDLEIIMGKHIRVGSGPLIPIDEFGSLELTLPEELGGLSVMRTAAQVVSAEFLGEELNFDDSSMALFAEDTTASISPWRNPVQLQKILDAIDTLPQPGKPIAHPRLPVWGELVFLSIIALSAAMLLRLPHLSRSAAFSLLVFASVGLLAVLLKTTLTWIPLIPVVATSLVGLFLTFHLSKYAPAPTVVLPPNEPEH